MLPERIEITGSLSIPRREVTFVSSRSSGPGGQNVNKVSTRMTLLFDVEGSSSLSPAQRRRILRRLATRVNRDGVLRVTSQRFRSQAGNRRAVVEHFAVLLAGALARRRARVRTRVPAAARHRRLEVKRRRSRLKRQRRAGDDGEE